MENRICTSCGAPYDNAATFCPSCGTFVQWGESDEDSPNGRRPIAPPVSPPDQPARREPVRYQPTSPVLDQPQQASRGTPPPAAEADSPVPRTARRIPTVVGDLGPPRSGLVPQDPFAQNDAHANGSATRGGSTQRPRSTLNSLTEPPQLDTAGGTSCRVCQHNNPSGRRYCRCGARLDSVHDNADASRKPRALPAGNARGFTAAMRSAMNGQRPRFDASISPRVRVIRTFAVLAAIAVATFPFTAAGASAQSWLSKSAQTLIPYGYQLIPVVEATVEPPAAAVDAYLPPQATDGTSSLAWGVAWTDAPLAGSCGSASTPALVLRFAGPTPVTRVIVNAGLDPVDTNRSGQVAPRFVDIRLSDDRCQRVELAEGNADQEFPLGDGQATTAKLQVVGIYPQRTPPSTAGGGGNRPIAALSEVRFYHG